VGPGGDCRPYRCGAESAGPELVTRAEDEPYNVIEPGKRPPRHPDSHAGAQDGAPFLAFAMQGGDAQDQNLLQFFLDIVEFGMTPQQASEAPNINSYQMRSSFGEHEARPGRLLLASSTPDSVRATLQQMGYTLDFEERTVGTDQRHHVRPPVTGPCGGRRAITVRTTASRGSGGERASA